MADSLVFDFPDPTPHFDFDNFSHGGISSGGLSNASSSRDGSSAAAAANNANAVNISSSSKKNSSKKSGRALFKSRFMNKKSQQQQQQQRPASPVPEAQRSNINNGDHSPLNKSMGDQSGTTATTASLSVGSGSFSPGRMQSSSSAVVTPATPPPPPNNHSNTNTTTGRESPRFEFTLFDDTSPSPKSSHSGMRKSLLTKQPNPYSNLTATTTNTTTSHSQLNSQENNLYTSYGLSSDRTAASGYISEVSEFSFDRVTVTTERTGMSSNVSWNFMDNTDGHLNLNDLIGSGGGDDGGGGILGALGGTTATGGRGGGTGGGGSSKLMPPDIDNLLLDNDDDLLHHHDDGGGPHHHPNRNRMNVFTGEIHKCDQSVISEISEGIDGHDDPHHGNGNGMDFINSLLLEKYNDDDDAGDEGGKGVNVPSLRPRSSTQKQQQQQAVATATPLQKQSSSNNNTISTVSTSATNSGGESVYDRYKQHRQQHHQQQRNINSNSSSSIKGNKPTQTKRSIFKAIMEDIQFCGMYFCGLDTTVEDDGQLTDNDTKKKDVLRSSGGGGSPGGGNSRSKEARKKEMDSTFLGKFVNCATCGPEM